MASEAEISPPELGTLQAGLRLRRLQRLAASLGLDGLLAVPGLDGRFNAGSAQLLGHLLQGTSNRDAADAVHLSTELLDSVLLLTQQGVAAYAPSMKAAAQLSEMLGDTVPGVLQVVSPTPAEASDPDAVEECKLGTFVQMLRGMQRLGIPWAAASATSDAPKPMELEKWPLLQAYGLEGVGRAGFFTQNFQAVDISQALQQQVYGPLDGHAMEHYMAVAAPTLQQHWFEMIKMLSNKSVGDLTERQVAEPLLSYFSYGMLRPAHGVCQAVTMMPKVLVGTRTNDDKASSEATALRSVPGLAADRFKHAVHFIVEAADGRSPLRAARTYFLSQGVLTPNLFADPDEEQEEGYSYEQATKGWEADDAVLLMRLYTAVVAASKAAMQHFATELTATAASAKAVALEQLAQGCEALGVPQPRLAVQARFALWECDHLNNVQPAAVRGSRRLKVLRLAVHDIPSRSPAHPGAVLGAVAYADTFLEVPAFDGRPAQLLNLTERLPPLVAASALGAEAAAAARASRSFLQVASMSREVAEELGEAEQGRASLRRRAAEDRAERKRRQAARGRGKEAEAAAQKLRGASLGSEANGAAGDEEAEEEENGAEEEEADAEEEEEEGDGELGVEASGDVGGGGGGSWGPLGRLLTLGGGEEAVLLTGAAPCSAVRGTLWCFAGGLAFVGQGTGALWVLPFLGHLDAITVQELQAGAGAGEAIGEAVVLRGRQAACGFPPACLLTTNVHIAIPLAGMTLTGRKHMLSAVLPAWQRTCREAAAAGAGAEEEGEGEITYRKDASAPSPFAGQQYGAMLAAVQAVQVGKRRWPAMILGDDAVEEAVARLDRLELAQGFAFAPSDPAAVAGAVGAAAGAGAAAGEPLGPLDPQVEALLLGGSNGGTTATVATAATAALTLVVGAPGAELSAVAAALLPSGSAAGSRCALLPSGGGGLSVSQPDLDAAVAALAAQAARGGGGGAGGASAPLLLLAQTFDSVPALLAMLARCPDMTSGKVRLGSVVACVAADAALQDPARGVGTMLPCVYGHVAPGYVDAVVVSGLGAVGAAAAAGAADVLAAVQRRLPEGTPVLVLRGSGAAARATLARSRDDLLGLPAAERRQRLQDTVHLRRWALPPATAPGGQPGAGAGPQGTHQLLWGAAQCVLLTFRGQVDQAELRAALQRAGLPSAPGEAEPLPIQDPSAVPAGKKQQRLLSAFMGYSAADASSGGGTASASSTSTAGPAPAAGVGPVVELSASRQAALRSREWALQGLGQPAYGGIGSLGSTASGGGGGSLLVVGTDLDPQALKRLLEACGKGAAAAAAATAAASAPRTVASLTAEERSQIARQHLFDDLPPGCCFDGTTYRDEFGDVLKEHPFMPRFVEQYLAQVNAELDAAQSEARAAAAQGALTVTAAQLH